MCGTGGARQAGRGRPAATLFFGLPYYARWATVAAKTLINEGLITPDELSAKLDEVSGRDFEAAAVSTATQAVRIGDRVRGP